jgi:6-phosphogluconolactonase/glucosamine-6-phosphate isomerase/deaminase
MGQVVAFDATCPGCGEDVHTCTNCSQFDTSARFECRQEIAEPILKKAKRNDCELFSPKTTQEFDTDKPSPDDARAAFDSLFDL